MQLCVIQVDVYVKDALPGDVIVGAFVDGALFNNLNSNANTATGSKSDSETDFFQQDVQKVASAGLSLRYNMHFLYILGPRFPTTFFPSLYFLC